MTGSADRAPDDVLADLAGPATRPRFPGTGAGSAPSASRRHDVVVTGQIADEVRYGRQVYLLTAVDGHGLFEPAAYGLRPGPLSTACWRGYICAYGVDDELLRLRRLEMGPAEDGTPPPALAGVDPVTAGRKSWHRGALLYEGLDVPVDFTGRLLLGAEPVGGVYLNMGFRPAWLCDDVLELRFDGGRLVSAYDRSAALAAVRERLGSGGAQPRDGETSGDWIRRTFSLTFDYSWPSVAPDN